MLQPYQKACVSGLFISGDVTYFSTVKLLCFPFVINKCLGIDIVSILFSIASFFFFYKNVKIPFFLFIF